MKTLNEQIQRLRDILVTCYNAIAAKGGIIPEVGERNMTNLPAAVKSVPQVVSAELEELTITENGTYTPSEGVDGFSQVIAEFDPSSLPKIKIGAFNITNVCINEDGRWPEEQLNMFDLSTLKSFGFSSNSAIRQVDFSGFDFSGITSMGSFFRNCSNLTYCNFSNLNTVNVTSLYEFCPNCYHMHTCNLENFNAQNIGDLTRAFLDCYRLVNLVERTIEDVIVNNIGALNGLKISLQLNHTILNHASLRAVINGLADLTGQTAQTLTIGARLLAKLTEEDIAVATNKNWTIA